jgi:hypothetical protein
MEDGGRPRCYWEGEGRGEKLREAWRRIGVSSPLPATSVGNFHLVAEVEPVLTAGNAYGIVAFHCQVIENAQVWAGVFPGVDAVEADVELLAVGWVRIKRMDNLDSIQLQSVILVTSESIGGDLGFDDAAGPPSSGGPLADSGVLVELELAVTLVGLVDTVNAEIEGIADSRVFMSEDTVLSRTLDGGRCRRLKLEPIPAVDIEGVIALLSTSTSVIEDQTIRTQLGLRDLVVSTTLVVLVTLVRIRNVVIVVGASYVRRYGVWVWLGLGLGDA